MPRKTAVETVAEDATTGTLAFLRAVAGEEMLAAAMPILRERMKLTPEKLAILLDRVLRPDVMPDKGDEAILRDLDTGTLKKYKDAFRLPERIGMRETRAVQP